jgi:hypothetical protein
VSFVITTDIFCDGENCNNWTYGAVGLRIKRKDAMLEARDEKWKVTLKKHLCPECVKAVDIP